MATAVSATQINLSWTASTDNVGVTGYKIERCSGASCSSFSQINTATGTTFSDAGLAASTSYSYRVRAADAAGNLSSFSLTATASTTAAPDTTPPSAPTNLMATAASATQINLSWTASADNVGVTGYKIEHCQGAGCSNFAQINTATGTTFSDAGLAASTSYSYRVRASDAANNLSMFSNTATASTLASGIVVTITPKRAALTTSQTQQFTPSVTGTANQGVNWFVDGVAGGNATAGTITAAGLYTPGSAAGRHNVTASSVLDGTTSQPSTAAVTDLAGVFTWHNDLARTGVNAKEYALDTTTVNSATFGKLFSCAVDGYMVAQPLWVGNLTIGGSKHNVVFVATENASLYAFDADDPSCKAVWSTTKVSLVGAGETAVQSGDLGSDTLGPTVGISGTPVIDLSANTLYAVTFSENPGAGTFVQRLHAVNILTGTEVVPPVMISGSVTGSGYDNSNGVITFTARRHNQRPALLLLNGVVYISWASFDDVDFYHGWVMGYSASTLAQTAVFNVTRDGQRGGIWMSGGGPAADSAGSIFLLTGNGDFNVDQAGRDYGDSFLKLSGTLTVTDYFTPSNQSSLEQADLDLGGGGAVVLMDPSGGPHPHLVVGGGKEGKLYVLNRDSMGQFHSGSDSQIVQSFTAGSNGIFSTPVFWQNTLYSAAASSPMSAFAFNITTGLFGTAPISQSPTTFGFPGATPTLSAAGTTNGILWAIQRPSGGGTAVLHAYNATNLANELWNSGSTAGAAVKFSVPTVANGKVYVGTQTELDVYGLLP